MTAPVGRLPCILCGPIFPFLGSFRFVRNPFLKEPRSRKRNVESIVCLHVKKGVGIALSKKQAIAIGLSEARKKGKKVARKKSY